MDQSWDYTESRGRVVAIDTETFLIAPGRLAPDVVCVTIRDLKDSTPRIYDRKEGIKVFGDLVRDKNTVCVFANAPFDLGVLVHEDPSTLRDVFEALEDRRIADVQTWQRLFMIAHGFSKFDPTTNQPPKYSLEECVRYWLSESVAGKHGDDPWRKKYGLLVDTPLDQWPEEARQYALLDADYTARVWSAQTSRHGIPPNFWDQCKYHWGLHLMSAWGLRTQKEAVDRLIDDLNEHIGNAMPRLVDAGIYRWGGTKAKPKLVKNMAVLRERVANYFDKVEMPPPRTEPSERFPEGQIQTSDEILEKTDDEMLRLLAEIGSDQKLLTTYVSWLRRGESLVINPSYTVLVDTGRTSSSNPNIQNQPRRGGVRECFVPRKGHIFIDIDYNIAELRSLSQVLLDLFGESQMAESIKAGDIKGKGYDVHCFMAAAIMDIDQETFAERFKKGDKECKDMRQLAKAVDFGAPGGLGSATLIDYARVGYGVTIDQGRAVELIELFKNTFPEMRRYFYYISQKSSTGDFQIAQHRSGRQRGGLSYTNGCNTLFQGLTADGAKLAVYNVMRECYLGVRFDTGEPSPLYGCRPVAFVHDEIMLEAPFHVAVEAADRAAKVMCDSMNQFTPDVPAVAEPCLMRRWYKDAEPEFKDGALVPWVPKNPGAMLRKMDKDKKAEHLYHDKPWAAEEVQFVKSLKLEPKVDWKTVNRMWELELLAREHNPDPWC